MHRLRDRSHFNMRDLDRSHVTYIAQVGSTYASYPQWAQIELILTLRCTVYKIEAILLRRMCDLERSHDSLSIYVY